MKKSTLTLIFIIVILTAVAALSYTFLQDNLDSLYLFKDITAGRKRADVENYLTTEECFRQGGRTQLAANGQECQDNEKESGDVIGYLDTHVCCVPTGEDRQKIISGLLKDKYKQDVGFDIDVDHPAFVRGKLIGTSKIFLASKYDGKWQINLIGEEVNCEDISQFDYPKSVVPECFYSEPQPPAKHPCSVGDEDIECPQDEVEVCGWLDIDQGECTSSPCAINFANDCLACREINIKYWTEGECPAPN